MADLETFLQDPGWAEPADHYVEIRIQDAFTVRADDGGPGTYVTLEVAYEQSASRAG